MSLRTGWEGICDSYAEENQQLHDRIEALEERNAKLIAVLMKVDHTLVVHGHIDKDTPLHERIRKLDPEDVR